MFRARNHKSCSNLFCAGTWVMALLCASVYLFAKQVWVSCWAGCSCKDGGEEMIAKRLPQHTMQEYSVLTEAVIAPCWENLSHALIVQ